MNVVVQHDNPFSPEKEALLLDQKPCHNLLYTHPTCNTFKQHTENRNRVSDLRLVQVNMNAHDSFIEIHEPVKKINKRNFMIGHVNHKIGHASV